MDERILKQRIHGIQDDIRRLNNATFALEASNYKNYPENFLEFSLDTVARAEKIACKLRHLIGDYGTANREILMERIAETHGIEIRREDDTICIPRPLPKATRHRSSEFLTQPLYHVMNNYCNEQPVKKYRECAVCFIHVYDEKLSLGRIRDYDNTETRNVLNAVAAFFLTDDTGRLCDTYHTTALGEFDCAFVYIMPQQTLPGFVSKRKSTPNPTSNFEAPPCPRF